MPAKLEGIKAKLKAQMERQLDGHFAPFEAASNGLGFDTDKIGGLAIENHRKITGMFDRANSELIGNLGFEKKQPVLRKADGNDKKRPETGINRNYCHCRTRAAPARSPWTGCLALAV